jgi:hypothetical protein
MQRKPLSLIICFLPALIFMQSCKKDNATTPKTKTELITSGSWKIDKVTLSGIDYTSMIETCQKDNSISFQANGTGSWDEGPTKCDNADPQTNPFTWDFQSNETLLHISDNVLTGTDDTLTILTLTDSQLILSEDVDLGGTTQTIVVTFKH